MVGNPQELAAELVKLVNHMDMPENTKLQLDKFLVRQTTLKIRTYSFGRIRGFSVYPCKAKLLRLKRNKVQFIRSFLNNINSLFYLMVLPD